MGRRKIQNRNIRKIQKSKQMYYISIPIEIMREFKWKERQKVVVEKYGSKRIIIRDWEK
jgi:bifunctional DNA-binding transcriptional regulator/antitoxin component of YhaV-PrlF toxin-antitoxin module